MGTGYTRNDTANNIADGNVINASDLDGEFDAIQAAFNATTGHSHDGTTGEGPQIGTGGIADDAVTLGTKTTGNYVATGAVSGVGLSGSASAEGATFTVTSNATDANTASTIVARDASGNFSAGNVTVGNLITAGNVDGRDVSADGSKLDGIEAGATADQTASEILTLIKTVDGAGSGLDADTLDGVSSASFLRSDAADTKTSGDLSFADSVKAQFGASNDLQIYHDGSQSYITDTGTGSLRVRAEDFILQNADGSNTFLYADAPNGAVLLYHNGNQKFQTTSSGIDVTGTVTFDGGTTSANLNFGDNDKAVFGDGNDLSIYHSGSHSYVQEGGSGSLYLLGQSQVVIGKSDATATYAAFNNTGSVDLYFNNAKKLATKSDGVDITGELQSDSLDVDGNADIAGTLAVGGHIDVPDNIKMRFGAGDDLQIYHDGAHSYVKDAGTGNLYIQATDLRLGYANGEFAMLAAENGAVELYHDNSKKFETNSSGVTVTGQLNADGLALGDNESANFGASNDLQIYHDGTHSYINDQGTGSLYILAQDFYMRNAANNAGMIYAANGGAVSLYYNGSFKFATNSTGVNVSGDINAVDNIYVASAMYHEGDTDTYTQFHNANEWRVVTGGTEMLEVNNDTVNLNANSVGAVQTVSRTGATTPGFQTYNSFVWTLTGNVTLNNPTTELSGMSGVFIFIQDATGGRTVSLGTDYETAGGAGLTLSSTAGAIDIVPYFVQAPGSVLLGTPQLAFA